MISYIFICIYFYFYFARLFQLCCRYLRDKLWKLQFFKEKNWGTLSWQTMIYNSSITNVESIHLKPFLYFQTDRKSIRKWSGCGEERLPSSPEILHSQLHTREALVASAVFQSAKRTTCKECRLREHYQRISKIIIVNISKVSLFK